MFQSARIKLTGWYLLIIMLVSIFFSLAIYSGINRELSGIEHFQRMRLEQDKRGFNDMFEQFRQEREERGLPAPHMRRFMMSDNPEMVKQARLRLTTVLIFINFVILAIAGLLGYFLAGKTLLPIKEMMDEQKRFVTDASHELRTPLTSLRTEIEVNLRDKKLTLSEAKYLLKSNLEEVVNLQALSDNLIKLSQYQKDINTLKFAQFSLAAVIDESVKKVNSLARHKDIAIENEITDFTFEGIDDKKMLSELFAIFLDNAIKFSPKGQSVKITSKKTDGHIVIEITDQGSGIAGDEIPHIFDRFYRAEKSRNKLDVPGYGLGLSIAKQIVDKHHGSISVKSEPDKGTTFAVRLPIKR